MPINDMNAPADLDLKGMGISTGALPAEFSQGLLENLDRLLQGQEKRQTTNILDQQEERGLFRSGDTESRIVGEVLGPSVDRRRSALMELISGGLNQGREERLDTQNFDRSKEMATVAWDRRLKELQMQLDQSRELAQLTASQNGFGAKFAQGLGSGLGAGVAGAII